MKRCLNLAIVGVLAIIVATEEGVGQEESALSQKIREIDMALKSPETLDTAVRGIEELLDQKQTPSRIRSSWLPALSKAGKHEATANLALKLIIAMPDSNVGFLMLELRSKELLLAGRGSEALSSAKAAFNVCNIADTERAIQLLVEIGEKSGELSAEACRRLKLDLTKSSGVGENETLKRVKFDAAPFKKLMDELKSDKSFRSRTYLGNLLLICDQAEDGLAHFQKLLKESEAGRERVIAAEGVARSLRAKNGNMSEANTWLMKIYSPVPMAPSDAKMP